MCYWRHNKTPLFSTRWSFSWPTLKGGADFLLIISVSAPISLSIRERFPCESDLFDLRRVKELRMRNIACYSQPSDGGAGTKVQQRNRVPNENLLRHSCNPAMANVRPISASGTIMCDSCETLAALSSFISIQCRPRSWCSPAVRRGRNGPQRTATAMTWSHPPETCTPSAGKDPIWTTVHWCLSMCIASTLIMS